MTANPVDIPTLETKRLSLVPLSYAHSQMMFSLWSHPEVCRYAGPVADYEGEALEMPAPSPAVSDKIIDFWLRAAQAGWGFRWAISDRSTDLFVGHIGFNSLGSVSEIAYHLLPAHWGKGIMSEAGRAAIDWAVKTTPNTVLEAFIEPDNTSSITLVERLGFKATGTFSKGAQCFRLQSTEMP